MCLEVNSNRVTVMRGVIWLFALDVPVDGQMVGLRKAGKRGKGEEGSE